MNNRKVTHTKSKKIWFDITNAPHVLTFKPFIDIARKSGYNVTITARDLSQACALLEKYGYRYTKIGGHKRNSILKIIEMIIRTIKLTLFGLREKPNILFTKSLSGAIAAWLLGTKSVFFTDNEYSKMSLARYISNLCVCPEVLPFTGKNVLKYPGIEEGLYLQSFTPDPKVKKFLKKGKINVLVRSTPMLAHYLKNKEDPINKLLELLSKNAEIHTIYIPRYKEENIPPVYIPPLPVDAPSLEYFVDVVVSGGGTMCREAAFLGTPAISMYPGKMLAVDHYLTELGVLHHTTNPKVALEWILNTKKKKNSKMKIPYQKPDILFSIILGRVQNE